MKQPTNNPGKLSSLVSAFALLLISVFVLGLGLLWALEMLGFGETSTVLIASQLSIAILALALFKFKYAEFFEIFKVKFKMKNIGHIFIGVASVIGVNWLVSVIINSLKLDTGNLEQFTSNTTQAILDNGGIIVLFIMPVIIAPIFEEVAFRAGFKHILVDKGGWKPYQYVIISSILFGLLHWQPGAFSIYPIILTASMGVINSILYLKTRNIFIPIISHMLYNLIIISAALFVV